MNDLALNPLTGDLLLKNGDLSTVKRHEHTAQSLKIRLQFFQGEWFLDVQAGLPYFQEILVKGAGQDRVDALFKEQIKKTPGVIQLLSYSSEYIPATRRLKLAFSVKTANGDISFNDQLSFGGGL